MATKIDRTTIEEQMPILPDGYYFKVTRPFLGYQEVRLMQKRRWWFDKNIAGRTHAAGYLTTPNRVSQCMRDVMTIHGGNEALAASQGGRSRLAGKYVKPAVVMPPVIPRPDDIEYDEKTDTFSISDELIERLRNGI